MRSSKIEPSAIYLKSLLVKSPGINCEGPTGLNLPLWVVAIGKEAPGTEKFKLLPLVLLQNCLASDDAVFIGWDLGLVQDQEK